MDDLISRQDAINVADAVWSVTGDKNVAKVWDQIKDLPSAQPEDKCGECDAWNQYKNYPRRSQWIPCSERLPEENGRYLVTRGLNTCGVMWNRVYIINYSDLMGLKSKRIWWDGNVGKSDFERFDDVLAWKPFEEPWKGEQK